MNGKEEIFQVFPEAQLPFALQEMILDDPSLVIREDRGVLQAWGRYFTRANLSLPVDDFAGSIQLVLWLEVSEGDVDSILSVYNGGRRSYSAAAVLACDVPGWPGTAGSPCRYQVKLKERNPRITYCADKRIRQISTQDYDQATLYRKIWGNSMPLQEADTDSRSKVAAHWKKHLGRDCFRKPIAPPPQLAGITPAEICVAPPIDTGESALLATVGCSDVRSSDGKLYEIFTLVRNPPEEFLKCFGEFAYVSRMNFSANLPGAIVPEKRIIPGSKMVAWLLCDPWWEEASPKTTLEKGDVQYLYALPLHPIEMAYATIHGEGELIDIFQERETDIAFLEREAEDLG